MLKKGGFGMVLAVNVIGNVKVARNESVKRNMVRGKAVFLVRRFEVGRGDALK